MKKTFHIVFLALMAAAMVAGCGSSDTASEDKAATAAPKPGPDKVETGPAAVQAEK